MMPFSISVSQAQLDDLRRRLERTRLPESETVDDWSQGVPLAQARDLLTYWRDHYDWRRCEAAVNRYAQFVVDIDYLPIWFLHVRSPHRNAKPLLMTHGWPGAVLEFLGVIDRLTDPVPFGGDEQDAFHLVLPALPGYGFSGKPTRAGWGVSRIAKAWDVLMARLGYTQYLAQGGDWGAAVTTALGVMRPPGLQGIHVNMPLVRPREIGPDLQPDEARMLAALEEHQRFDSGYSHQQSTRPQTLGYALADSPAGQAMWIFEKFHRWTDCDGDPLTVLSYDQMLDIITLYWLTNTSASSGQLYWESFRKAFFAVKLDLPVGCTVFPKDIFRAPRSWAERCMSQLVYWSEAEKGGHFPAFEQPELFAEELRAWARTLHLD